MARAELEVASCQLDLEGLRRQRERYERLGADVDAIERTGELLSVRFRSGVDEALLRETIEVERGCCPFFRFEFFGSKRLLQVSVERPEQLDALDAIAFALADPGRRRPRE